MGRLFWVVLVVFFVIDFAVHGGVDSDAVEWAVPSCVLQVEDCIAEDVLFGRHVILGHGTVISRGVVLGSDIVIGDGVFIGRGVSVGNGVLIGDDVVLDDDVVIGDHVTVGSGVRIARHVVVEDHVMVGMRTVLEAWCRIKSYVYIYIYGVPAPLGSPVRVKSRMIVPIESVLDRHHSKSS